MASIDMLSALPDDILSHVLSFLPFKTSVSTSTLAARWRFLWAYAPNIDLCVGKSKSIRESIHEQRKFVDVLTKVLSQCEAHSVNALRLNMEFFIAHEFEACLERAFACKMKTLDLTFLIDSQSLPPCVLTSESLVDLKLNTFDIKIKNGDVCLPALKRLRLEYVTLYGSLENLISGCPVLEEFAVLSYISVVVDETVVCQCISSPSMKRLVLGCELPFRLKIDTPALEYLNLYHIKAYNLSVGLMDSLIEAYIVGDLVKPPVNDNPYSRSLLEFVGRLSSVKKLSLRACRWGKVADSDSTPVIKFHNLAKLTVGGDWRSISYFLEKANTLQVLNVVEAREPECETVPLQLLPPKCLLANSVLKLHNLTKLELSVNGWFLSYFLEKADKLKVLIISRAYFNQKRWLVAPLQVPNCLSSHLKIVQIHELHSTEHELDMVRYLLKNAKVLERMEIHCLAESVERISSFDRGSEICEIVFHEYMESDDEDLGF